MKPHKERIRLAAQAHSDLNVFYVVISILEGGHVHAPSNTAAQQIIGICRREAGKRLRDYDKYVALLDPAKESPAT